MFLSPMGSLEFFPQNFQKCLNLSPTNPKICIVTPEIGNLNSRQERVNIHSMDYLLSTFTIIIFYYYYYVKVKTRHLHCLHK